MIEDRSIVTYSRDISPILRRSREIFPVVGINGPRQSGKTTVAKLEFPGLPYVSLENPDTRKQALEDPRAFLQRYRDGAIFDEVQNAPDLVSYLQEWVDSSPEKGRYVLTGSQNFALSETVSQSLAGRVATNTLLPLSLHELGGYSSMERAIFSGGYPALHQLKILPREFFPRYTQTYLERDVRKIRQIENLGTFQTFLRLCAGRVGQVINWTSLATDCSISPNTARQWLTLLEASYIVFTVQPFFKNYNKRLIKAPKLYFFDTGLACSLLDIDSEKQLETHYMRGALFENLVILEVMKKRLNSGLPAHLYFWRDQTGHEIDLITEWGGETRAIEIKAGATFRPEWLEHLQYFQTLSGTTKSYLVYAGEQRGTIKGTQLTPLRELHATI